MSRMLRVVADIPVSMMVLAVAALLFILTGPEWIQVIDHL